MSTLKNLNLKIGSSGPPTKFLQSILNSIIPLSPLLVEDGRFGQLTSDRVKAFQKKYGLVSDGIVGTKTTAKLNELVNQDKQIQSQVSDLAKKAEEKQKTKKNMAPLLWATAIVGMGIVFYKLK